LFGRIACAVMLSLLLISMLTLTFNIQPIRAEPKTWIVDDDGPADFHTIQEAVDAASDGDTILVRSGTYTGYIVVDVIVSLIGESMNNTFVSGFYWYEHSVISVVADYVWISGFTIQNGWCGIGVYSTVGCTIAENRIINNNYRGGGPDIYKAGRGIWLREAGNVTITENVVDHNDRNISLERAENNTIEDNIILNSVISWGIILESSSNNTIRNNVVKYSVYDGIYLVGSSSNKIIENSVMSNGDEGIYLGSSNDNSLFGNSVLCNPGEGIWFDWSNGNTVVGNNVMNNGKRGIFVWHSGDSTIYHNNFVNNTWGNAYSNLINVWDDGYPSGGNYWSDYTGVDIRNGLGQDLPGSDGIGDTPYIIEVDNVDHYPLMNPYGLPAPMCVLTITTAAGGTTEPAPGTYTYTANSTVLVRAVAAPNYLFDYWMFDGTNAGSANPYSVLMDKDHTLKAVFSSVAPPKPVGGISIQIKGESVEKPLTSYLVVVAILAVAFVAIKHKTNRKTKCSFAFATTFQR